MASDALIGRLKQLDAPRAAWMRARVLRERVRGKEQQRANGSNSDSRSHELPPLRSFDLELYFAESAPQ
jgi:hypothetical protein